MANKKSFTLEINGVNKSVKTVGELRQGIEELEQEFEKTEFGSDKFRHLQTELKRANSAVDEFDDSVAGLTVEDKVGLIGDSVAGLGQTFAGVQGAVTAFAGENEKLEETLVKVGGSLAIADAAEGLGRSLTVANKAAKVLGVSLKALTTAGVVGLVITAGAAVAANWERVKSIFTGVKSESLILADVQSNLYEESQKVAESFAKEQFKARKLFITLKDTNKGTDERNTALKELNKLYPNFLKNISVEESTTEDLAEAQEKVNKNIKTRIRIESIRSEAQKLITKQTQAELEIRKQFAGLQRDAPDLLQEKGIKNLEDFKNSVQDLIDAQEKFGVIGEFESIAGKARASLFSIFGLDKAESQLARENAADAVRDAENAGKQLEVIFELLEESQKDLTKATKNNTEETEDNTVATDKNNKKIKEQLELLAKRNITGFSEEYKKLQSDLQKVNDELQIAVETGMDTTALEKQSNAIRDRIRAIEQYNQAIQNGNVDRAKELFGILTSDQSDSAEVSFDAINNQIKRIVDNADKSNKSVEQFWDNLSDAEKAEFIVERLNDIVGLISQIGNLFQQQTEMAIEQLDTQIEGARDRKSELDDELKDSQSKIKELETTLADVRVSQRGKIIKSIKQEKSEIQSLQSAKNKQQQQEEELARKKRKLQIREFKRQKAINISEAISSTAVAVTQALSSGIPIPGLILAPIAAAQGAAQVATISAQKPPSFAKGGYTGSGDANEPAGIVHKGEYVVPKHITESPSFQPTLNKLEEKRMKGYATGGQVESTESRDELGKLNRNLQKAMDRPVVADVREFTKKQNKVKKIESKSKL